MSGKPKPLAIQVMERSRAPGTARLVLLGYAYFGDPDGSRITAGPERVAARAGVTVRTLERYRPELLELGELEVVRLGRSGRHAEYRICLPPAVSNGANLAEPASPSWRRLM